jgi:hypothetical protein
MTRQERKQAKEKETTMYQQINPTEMFRERHLVLLNEAANRRLSRRLRAARSSSHEKGMRRLKRTALLFVAVMATVVLASTAALAEIRVGTDSSEALTGTNSADQISGKGGNDILEGKAANDTYHFDVGFGDDVLTETATVKVGKKKLPGGTDTLNFSRVGTGSVDIRMIPQWAALGYNDVIAPNGDTVELGISPVENAVGGSGSDIINGGSAMNTYKGGPGGDDSFFDYGGWDGDALFPGLVASNDTYKGFTSGTGNDEVEDFGGTADKLDLRPLETSDVYFDSYNSDSNLETKESLRIIIGSTSTVSVIGHFSPITGQENGRMEQIIFSNEVVTSAASML